MPPDTTFDARAFALASRHAARTLGNASTQQKDEALAAMARALRHHAPAIERENQLDMQEATAAGKNAAFLDRLLLNAQRIATMADAVDAVRALEDPVGQVTEQWTRPNGLRVRKQRLPLGVVLMIYEARPNVTSDASALCLKSGNAAMLRGGSESFRTNLAIQAALHEGLTQAGLPREAIALVPSTERESMLALLQLDGLIDLCIPRGGEGLIRFVAQHARVPVVKHYQGVCHVYVEKTADLDTAQNIIVNAKASRPGVCNAAECLLVDEAIAAQFLPRAAAALKEKGVELRGDDAARAHIDATPAQESDWGREFLDLILAVKVVRGFDEALSHIARYGSEHTEAIVTRDEALAARFTREVTASAVVVNASTRFNDGGELGLGAEVGISTTRLHAFGPMGLKELTAQKYVVEGDGQVR